MTVVVLFARGDSCYKAMPECDVWDRDRDATRWHGRAPVVAHPPCRAWGALRRLAKPRQGEKALAPWAAQQVRRCGGVLEHPAGSSLWDTIGLPRPGHVDDFGGWTLPVSQHWWGHRAEKMTWLYIVGCAPADIPVMPMQLGAATHVIASSGRRADGTRKRKGDQGWRPEVTEAEREHTPPQFAVWLVDLAQRCSR